MFCYYLKAIYSLERSFGHGSDCQETDIYKQYVLTTLPQRRKTKYEDRQVVVPLTRGCW
jgi:hypothetical protein